MYKIFIIEDDDGISEAISRELMCWGINSKKAGDYHNVMSEFCSYAPHLVLMDIGLPYMNGYHWCKEIRKVSSVPIMFISSAADNMNIVMAVNMGGDDFVVKPFDLNVLVAKIQALLRRTYNFSDFSSYFEHRGAILSVDDGSLSYNGEKISLSKNEFRILLVLMKNKGKTVSREKLMEALWQTDEFVDENALNVNVGRLRKKLEAAGLDSFIETKFGVGYIVT